MERKLVASRALAVSCCMVEMDCCRSVAVVMSL
jgi:hypothetical protein